VLCKVPTLKYTIRKTLYNRFIRCVYFMYRKGRTKVTQSGRTITYRSGIA
jgi:hypothetical protein